MSKSSGRELIKVVSGSSTYFYFNNMKDVGAFLAALDKSVRTEAETVDINISRVSKHEPRWHKLDWNVQSSFEYSVDKWLAAGCPEEIQESSSGEQEAA